jgi:hypothetical protein
MHSRAAVTLNIASLQMGRAAVAENLREATGNDPQNLEKLTTVMALRH